jgi:hypothetical protein
MKDRTSLLIVILFGALVVITVYRGRFVTYTVPSATVQSHPAWRLSAEFEVYGNADIGIYPYLTPLDECKQFDSLSVKLQSKKDSRLRFNRLQRNDNYSDQNSVKSHKKTCPGDSISFAEVFEVPDDKVDSLTVIFAWKDSAGTSSNTQIDLVKKTSFTLGGDEKSSDVLILLYPILWMAFGVLILAKLTKLIKD